MGHRLRVATWDAATETAIVELYQRVWPGVEDHSDTTRWAFGGNPLGSAPLVLVNDDATDCLVGVRGGIAWPLGVGGLGIHRVVQLHGTAVDRSVRRVGIFSAMTERFLELTGEADVLLIFNVSVAAARRGYESLGWTYTDSLRRLVLPVRPIRMARLLAAKSRVEPAAPRSERSEPPDFGDVRPLIIHRDEQLHSHVRTSYLDRQFFEWRFGRQAHRWVGSGNDGFLVYRIRARGALRELLVGDIWPGRLSPRRLILRAIRRERPDLATSWTTNQHPYYGHLRRSGFLTEPGHSLNLGLRSLRDGPTIPPRWALMAADIDTF